MVRKNFGELKKGDVFYAMDEDNKDRMIMCMKCEHYDTDLINAMIDENEWVDVITNVVWMEDGGYGIEAGTLDWFPDGIKVWVA